jgi:hypothetical protein
MEQNRDILEEFQKSIVVCEWECYADIEEAFEQAFGEDFDTTNQYCYIIYLDYNEQTSIDFMYEYFHLVASQKTKKCLIVPIDVFNDLKKHIKSLLRSGKNKEAYEIGCELNKLYPDFNFFDI